MSEDEGSSKDEEFTDSLTSPTTACGSTPVDIPPSTAEAVEDNSNLPDSPIESQLASDMSCIRRSTPPDETTPTQ